MARAFQLVDLIGPEKVDADDVKILRERAFGYTTFWVTGQEPFGDSGEGVLLLGNLRGKREEVFAKLQQNLKDLMGTKYDLFMVEEPNAEEEDPRGGPRVSFVLLRKEVSDPGPTALWQYVIAALLFVLTGLSCLELGIASQVPLKPSCPNLNTSSPWSSVCVGLVRLWPVQPIEYHTLMQLHLNMRQGVNLVLLIIKVCCVPLAALKATTRACSILHKP